MNHIILYSSFFSDIIKGKGSEKLYQVTDEPSIVIKTDIVDTYITHKNEYCFKVKKNLGYGIYDVETINECEIVGNKLESEKK